MNEILESNARVGRVCDRAVIAVAAVSVLATFAAPLLWVWAGSVPLAVGLPSALIVGAVVVSAVVQRRAVRRHEALCERMAL